MYWTAIHNRGPGLIILLCGHLRTHLVQFITFLGEDSLFSVYTFLSPTLIFNLIQLLTYRYNTKQV